VGPTQEGGYIIDDALVPGGARMVLRMKTRDGFNRLIDGDMGRRWICLLSSHSAFPYLSPQIDSKSGARTAGKEIRPPIRDLRPALLRKFKAGRALLVCWEGCHDTHPVAYSPHRPLETNIREILGAAESESTQKPAGAPLSLISRQRGALRISSFRSFRRLRMFSTI